MNEGNILIFLLSGLFGGVLRGLVGIAKSKSIEKGQFIPLYLGVTLGVSALVGLVAGILADKTWEISFLAGYAGTDFLEGLYKLRFGQFISKS